MPAGPVSSRSANPAVESLGGWIGSLGSGWTVNWLLRSAQRIEPLALPPRRARGMPTSKRAVNTDLDDDNEHEVMEGVMKHTVSVWNKKTKMKVRNWLAQASKHEKKNV